MTEIPPEAIPRPEDKPKEPGPEALEARLYPMEEELFIDLLNVAEIGKGGDISEIVEVVQEALAFREGLTYGVADYDLGWWRDDEGNINDVILKLQNDFTTVEEATSRPPAPYLGPAMRKAIRSRIQEVKFEKRSGGLWNKMIRAKYPPVREDKYDHLPVADEQRQGLLDRDRAERERKISNAREALERNAEAEEPLMNLENHLDARRVLDFAFIQRMGTCETPVLAAELSNRDARYQPPTTPDKGHWQALFQGEFGEGVNKVLREIVKVAYTPDGYVREGKENVPGIPQTVYVDGFEKTEDFQKWIKHLYDTAAGRMDVVWTAWRLALTWELVNEFGKEVTKKGRYKLASPPLGNALFTWTTHLEEKRAMEFGLKADGTRMQQEKYISHTGLPMSLGKFEPLCRSFLHNSRVGEGKETKNLFDIWWEDEVKLADLPWYQTEHLSPGVAPGELTPGSFGGWLLKRIRAFNVVSDIRSQPPLGGRDGVSAPDFFAARIRNWGKVIGKIGRGLPPEENPRAWWVAGIIWYHTGGTSTKSPITKSEPFRDYRTVARSEGVVRRGEAAEDRGVMIGDIFRHATNCGFLRKEDVDWIKKKLGITLR